MILGKWRRRAALAAPVVLLGAVLVSNPHGIRSRLTGADPSAAAPKAVAGKQITILGSGDILVHPPTWAQAHEDATKAGQPGYLFDPMFEQIKDAVSSADLALCHLEIPAAAAPPLDFPAFRAPREIADTIKRTGWDGCSTASNHSFDQGEDGVRSTIAELDRAGVGHTGTYATEAASRIPKIYDVNGVKVAHLSFATMFNEQRGHFRPKDKPWLANRIGDKGAVAKAAKAARAAGADIVVLSPHWGKELEPEPSAKLEQLAREWTANPDIDLILGGHSHSVQPIELVNGKWVVYSMGNALARHDFPNDINRQGIMPRFTFTKDAAGKWTVSQATAIPIWQSVRPRIEVVDLPVVLSRLTRVDDRRALYQKAYDRIKERVLARGGAQHGLTVTAPVD